MSCGAGWLGNYARGKDATDEVVARHKRRLREGGDDFAVGRNVMTAMLDEIAELKLGVASVLQLLVRKGVLTEAELMECARQIDALDGSADGKLRGHVDPDGTITPDAPPPRSDLDDLADAVEGS